MKEIKQTAGGLQVKVVQALMKTGCTLVTAESCTGGLIAARITDVPGASGVFHCGLVTYSNDMKEKMLGVSPETLEKFSAVSKETAAEMAAGARAVSGADIAVAVTGNAGPEPSEGKPVGEVYLSVNCSWYQKVEQLSCPALSGDIRGQIRSLAAEKALAMVLDAVGKKETEI